MSSERFLSSIFKRVWRCEETVLCPIIAERFPDIEGKIEERREGERGRPT